MKEYLNEQNVIKGGYDVAVIVAGETLTAIQKDADLKEDFVTLADNANVVLACRVSPIQKAEVV